MAMDTCGSCGGSGQVPDHSQQHRTSGNYVAPGTMTCPSCGGSGTKDPAGCFAAGTLVTTTSGQIPIERVVPGMMICAYDQKQGRIVPVPTLKIRRYQKRIVWNLETSAGNHLRTTSRHSFRVDETWKLAESINTGDTLCRLSSDHNEISVDTVTGSYPSGVREDVYQLIVAERFCYFADNMLNHCFTNFRFAQQMLWTVYGISTRFASTPIGRARLIEVSR